MGEPLKVKLYSTLRNFLEMYTFRDEEVLVLEAVANALDAKADNVNIMFERSGANYYVRFVNDAPGMSEQDFENYHTLSLSSKSKGQGIGFAGVGAKIFLASDDGSEIITATMNGDGLLASRMYRQGEQIEYDMSTKVGLDRILSGNTIDLRKGTLYQVKLSEDGYIFLKREIERILRFWFNYAILSKMVTFHIDGRLVQEEKSDGVTKKKNIIHRGQIITCIFTISKDKIPEEQRHIVYTVFGKRIKNEFVDFAYQIQGDNSSRVCCLADVSILATELNSNKEDFDKTPLTNAVRTKIRQAFFEFLKLEGLIRESNEPSPGSSIVTNELTKRLDLLLQQKEFKFLNPWFNPRSKDIVVPQKDGDVVIEKVNEGQEIMGGIGDTQTPIKEGNVEARSIDSLGGDEGSGYVRDDDGNELGKTTKKNAKGLFIIVEEYPDDPREGWVDMESKGVVYNEGHPFAKNFRGSKGLFDYNITRVVISALIKAANDKKAMDAKMGLELLERVLHGSW
jgi:hypothetical protein